MWGDDDEVLEDWGLEDEEVTGIDAAAHTAATSKHNDLREPTAAQKESGVYRMGHHWLAGLNISIENPQGSYRYDLKNTPPKWKTLMRHHYGYIRGTVGQDGDQIDVFVKPGTPDDFNGTVFVIDQVKRNGAPDEHKVMLGFASVREAREAYLSNYTKGWRGLGAITAVAMADFKQWLKGDTSKPFSERFDDEGPDVPAAAKLAAAPAAEGRDQPGGGDGDMGPVPRDAAGGDGDLADEAEPGDGADSPVLDAGGEPAAVETLSDSEAFADDYAALQGLTVEQVVKVAYSETTATLRMDAAQAMRALDARLAALGELAKCMERGAR